MIKGKEIDIKELSMFDFSNLNIEEFTSVHNNTLQGIKDSILEVMTKPKIDKNKLNAMKKLQSFLELKIMSRKFDFWLPLKDFVKSKKTIKERII